jgi:hypothetical protein
LPDNRIDVAIANIDQPAHRQHHGAAGTETFPASQSGFDLFEFRLHALSHGANNGHGRGGIIGELAGDLRESYPRHMRPIGQRVDIGPEVVDEQTCRIVPG